MKPKASSLSGLLNTQPKTVRIEQSLQPAFLTWENGQLALFTSNGGIVNLADWIQKNQSQVNDVFRNEGAILFRGFEVNGNAGFTTFVQHLSQELMDYAEPSTPRSKIADKVYTSTEYPNDQFIPMHNEHSYSTSWPQKIWFYCVKPAAAGGATPVCDSRKVFDMISPSVRQEFIKKGVMYVRNYGDKMDLPWQAVFDTNDKKIVEAYCRKAGIDCTWKEDGNLRTSQVCQAVLAHPRTKEMVWFNQAHLFHISNLEPLVQQYLLEQFGEANLPRNAYFGDGSSIPLSFLEEIRHAYRQAQLTFDWQKDDVLMLDNILFAHGRNPFEGERKVLVAMADPYDHKQEAGSGNVANQVNHHAVSEARHDTAKYFLHNKVNSPDPAMLKYQLAASCRMMVSERLDEGGISGHISIRVPGRHDEFWVNPFGLLAEEVTPGNLIRVNKAGRVLEGDHPVNVAGFCIHASIHSVYPEVNCIVHTHSPWGTLYSALGKHIEPIDQNCCLFFENHALYDEFNGPVNDPDEALKLVSSLAGRDVVILRNHGAITCGNTIASATMRMIAIERAFRLNVLAQQAGNVQLISPDTARLTRDWIGNEVGFAIEYNALLRKVERIYPDLKKYKPVETN